MQAPKIAVMASGDGSNFEALVQASRGGILHAEVVGLIASRGGIPALKRAERLNIPTAVLMVKNFAHRSEWDAEVLKTLRTWRADWVVLAGYLSLLGPAVLKAYPDKVVNIHPALLPKFGGPGMYGLRVHEAVLAARAEETGITVHLVDAEYDHGRVLAQFKIRTAGIRNAEALAARVRELEHEHYPRVLNDLLNGRLTRG